MIADLPASFRAGCHWALFVESYVGTNGLPHMSVPLGASLEVRTQALRHAAAVAVVRSEIFPSG